MLLVQNDFLDDVYAENAGPPLAAGEPCPLCAIYYEPNEETIAAMEEGDAIARGEIPSPAFDSFEDFLRDLKS